jgi:hypothetical protein
MSLCRRLIISKASVTKTVAVATVSCFLVSFVFGQAVAEVLQTKRDTKQFQQIFADFAIPHTAGRVTGAKYYGSPEIVINIQDLHCHAEVQKNIGDILGLLDKKFGLKKVYLEGASGQVDTGWLAGIKDREIRRQIVDSLLSQGKLTGAEYYSVASVVLS